MAALATLTTVLGIAIPTLKQIVPLFRGGDKKQSAAGLLRMEEINMAEAFQGIDEVLAREDIPVDIRYMLRDHARQAGRTMRAMDAAADILVGDDDAPGGR